MRMTSPGVEAYADDAIRFLARLSPLGDGKPIRVARIPVTCSVAVSVLNELGLPAESETTYNYVNVHNPRCPLFFDTHAQQWECDSAYEEHPVWGINWAGAALICQHMGGRLPLEREWECFASNNDPTRKYPWGDAPPTKLLANFGEQLGGTSPVRSYPASELGLYDLVGNLSEWCEDFYTVPGGQSTRFERVVKGGAWSKDAHFLEIAVSRGKWERLGTTTIGFRAVWDD
jgi:formylglycine-generating enzyme required for sulfatase activity